MEGVRLNSDQLTKWLRWFLFVSTINFSSPSFAAAENSTIPTGNPNITTTSSTFKCGWENLTFPIAIGPAIACILAIILGGFELFVGFKYFRTSLFATGVGGGAILTYFICIEKSNLSTVYVLLITAAVSIFIGILCTTVVFCGRFTCGLAAGFCVSMAFLLGFSTHFSGYNTISIPLGVMITIAVLFAGISVWWKRALIVMSCITGGALITVGIDYFIEDMWLCQYSLRKIFLDNVPGNLCLISWIILGLWPLLTVIGLLVQYLKTAKKPPNAKKGESRSRANRSGNADHNFVLDQL